MAVASAAPFQETDLLAEIRSALPYSALDEAIFSEVLGFIQNGGYALRAYDRFKRLTRAAEGLWRVSHPKFVPQHRLNAGLIVHPRLPGVRFANGRVLCTIAEGCAAPLSPGDVFFFYALLLEVCGLGHRRASCT